MSQVSELNQVLESVERLPVEDQEILIDVIRKRLIEKRRDELAQSIKQAQKDYGEGNVFRGTIEDVIAELNS